MKRRKVETRAPAASESSAVTVPDSSGVARISPLVFISHDSRDADLAEAFDHLLTDASGGVVQTFRSSDQSGRAGIDYGENWYSKIAKSLSDATDVVALLTPNSVGRPWILFEAGFAVGRLDAKVFGVALGIPLPQAVAGPFAQFQNCEANEESLTTVVLKLVQRNPNARPREQAVRRQVNAFLQEVGELLKQRTVKEDETQEEMNATAVAKLFEEVKVMFRDLPSRVESQIGGRGIRKRRRYHPMMVEEIFHMARVEEASPSLPWLLLASLFREDVPWLSQAALEVHRAMESGSADNVESAQRNLQATLRLMRHSRMLHRLERDDEESYMMMRHLPEMLDQFIEISQPERKKSRSKADAITAAPSPEGESQKG